MGSMERYSKVGMQELDQRLSKIVEAARKKPVSVYRYGAPWVWIVSQEDWQGARKEVSSYIPAGHSLVLLRPQIDEVLEQHRDLLQAAPGMAIAPLTVVQPSTSALGLRGDEVRLTALEVGDVLMPSLTPESVRNNYAIYAGKNSGTEAPAARAEAMRRMLLEAGFNLPSGPGSAWRLT